jgi:hypothetical protein
MAAHGGAMAAHGDSHWGRNTNENKTYNNPKCFFACGRLIGWGVLHSYLLHQKTSSTKNPTFAQKYFPAELIWFWRFPPMFLLHQRKCQNMFFLRSLFGSSDFDTVFAT